ncbi:UTP--glucose-1-phosphate uridylyltransferase [Candidatus Clavichlamydia salmonicola]|uniref:UTP--glucose-1-phosphate uridylyltransferase n=1 Tax=Candidatus Clavichlamydia salmonicola TaxID=469812 RepID=UPI00189127EA|nr:UTP--glucose-1-phosphate uridylyltransferase [Candidatus Clavichlamydia salmonicola]
MYYPVSSFSKKILSETFFSCHRLLSSLGQEKIFEHFYTLAFTEQLHLLHQIQSLDINLFKRQRRTLRLPKKRLSYTPLKNAPLEKDHSFLHADGVKLMAQGKTGCIIMAAGRGSRLDPNNPKGTFPISLVKNKSLFQLICEKTCAASTLCNQKLPIAFMLSPENFSPVLRYFQKHKFFGLDRDQIFFFISPTAPLFNNAGSLFLQNPYTIAADSLGNGALPQAFDKSTILDQWKKAGVEMINIIPVDNPLALPFDPVLFAYHATQKSDVTIKAISSTHSHESVGILVKDERQRTLIVDYSDLDERQKTNLDLQSYPLVNSGMYCFSSDFLKQSSQLPLSLHKVYKRTPCNMSLVPCWKFEYFLFDLFAFTDKVSTLVYNRYECFAPLKTLKGVNNPEDVQKIVMTHEKNLVTNLIGKTNLSNEVLEVDADFYYPSSQTIENWEQKVFFLNSCAEVLCKKILPT